VEGRAAEVVDAATRRSDTLGRTVAVRLAGGGVVEGRATRLLPSGALEVDVDGAPRPIDAGAIESARGS
jgi:biotin-(acetyl-CoA carboxylase) ligase